LFIENERSQEMNKTPDPRIGEPEAGLLEEAAEIVRGYGLEWTLLTAAPDRQGEYRPDAYVEIGNDQRKLELVVEAKTRLTTGQVGAMVAELERFDRPGLLIVDYVNPALAEELHRQNLYFIDMAGNAFLRDEGLLIWVTGRKDAQRIRTERETRRAFQPTGLRVIFALLCRPNLVQKDYRTLAEITDVALGTVQWVMRDLDREGFMIRKGRKERRLVDLDRLLHEWALGYARDLKNRYLLGRYEITAFDKWKEADLQPYRAAWGGEPAAALLTKYLKPETLTIWADKVPPRLIAELGLRPAEGGRVEIRQRFWKPELLEAADEAEGMDPLTNLRGVAPPVLVYAELLAIGDARTIETAKKLRDEWIDGPFRRHRARTAR
jgi:hypothetical protein